MASQTDVSIADFRRSIRSAIHCYWAGTCDLFGFTDTMVGAISRAYRRAWNEGASVCGIRPEERTPEEQSRLDQEIAQEISYILNFSDAIAKSSKAKGGRIAPLYTRGDMWVNRYISIRDLAKTYACADLKLKWVMNPLKEHCPGCLALDGRVYRASTWRKYDLYPRKHTLPCRGKWCGCEFIQTDLPCTPGRPPSLA